jgi:hypothetical protein
MPPPLVRQSKVEYGDRGIQCLSYTRASPDEIHAALRLNENVLPLTPRIAKANKRKYPRNWWEAQVRLYGIQCPKYTVDEMKGLLTWALGGLAVSPKIQEMEEAMAAEYRVSAKEWRAREKVEEVQREFQRKKAAKEYENWKSLRPEPPPTIQKSSYPPTDLSYSSRQTSNRVMDEINRLHAQLLRTGAGSDIGGTWRISCPDINGWRREDDSMRDVIWIIHPPHTSESFLWAQIDQVIVEGIARIEWPDPDNWKGVSIPFVWRGREEGAGEIQFQDSVNCGTITFTSAHECIGDFACEFGGSFDFIGRKVEIGLPERAKGIQECQKEFQGYNRKWWEWEGTVRWGGGGDYNSEEEEEWEYPTAQAY